MPDQAIPSTSHAWCEYFRSNASSLRTIPWELGVKLSFAELKAVTSSIQEFQLGESSEGRTFAKMAAEYARQSGDAAYIIAHGLFVAEEHRHARDLGKVMDLAGIPRVGQTMADGIFRKLRKLAGLEMSIGVLVTAEIIARVYYDALLRSTDSQVLRTLCEQILADEIKHIEFQCERLALMRRQRRRLGLAVTHGVHRVFMLGTCGVVWLKHRRVLKRGGYGVLSFIGDVWRELRIAMRVMNPRCYTWPAESATGVEPVAGVKSVGG
jgi:hypothetical protein